MSRPLNRIQTLQGNLSKSGIDAALLNYSRSLLYYAGTTHPSILIITPEDYHLIAIKGSDRISEETWLSPDKVSSDEGLESLREKLRDWEIDRGNLGMELDILPVGLYFEFCKLLPGSRIVDISKFVLEQRKIKDVKEIEYTKEACRIVHSGHERILEILREGMTELELSSEIEDAQRKAGHEGLYFIRQFDFFMGRGPLASGKNLTRIASKVQSITGIGMSRSIPMGASSKKIKKGEMIVVDIPAHCQGYHCDQSRTYVLGSASDGCKMLYNGMMEIADRIIMALKPGLRCDHLYQMACAVADELGVGPYFMRVGSNSKQLSFIGHGVGLELNEPPLLSKNSRDVIQEGMIFALELEMCKSPHQAVKLEDMILIAADGAEILTLTPRDLHQV